MKTKEKLAIVKKALIDLMDVHNKEQLEAMEAGLKLMAEHSDAHAPDIVIAINSINALRVFEEFQ